MFKVNRKNKIEHFTNKTTDSPEESDCKSEGYDSCAQKQKSLRNQRIGLIMNILITILLLSIPSCILYKLYSLFFKKNMSILTLIITFFISFIIFSRLKILPGGFNYI